MDKRRILQRGIMSTTHIDNHKDQVSVEMLEDMKLKINSDKKLRWGIDRNRQFPPLGRLSNAEIIKRGDHYYLEADYEPYLTQQIIAWDESLIMESFAEGFSFTEIEEVSPNEIILSVDPNSFPSKRAYKNYLEEINKLEYPIEASEHLRKANLPIPELIFTVGKTALLYQFLKPVAEKLAEETAKKLLEQGKVFYKFISKTISAAFRHGKNPNQPMVVIFQITDIPNVELIAKTKDQDLILKGLKKVKLEILLEEINFYKSKFEVEKIQFILNDKGKWKFTYLLTKEGSAIGKKEIFKKRDHRYEMLLKMNNGKIHNSVGLSGVKRQAKQGNNNL